MRQAIRRAGAADVEPLALLLAEAFHDLPPARWLVPDPIERAQVLAPYFRLLVEHAVDHGEVHTVTGANAVAIWYDLTKPPPPIPPDHEEQMARACGPWTERFQLFDRALTERHPRGAHHHLALLGVRPGHQRAGLGSALLAHHHEHLDRYAIPAYLEASSPRNRELYLRHGYEPLSKTIRLPDGPELWPMWRSHTGARPISIVHYG